MTDKYYKHVTCEHCGRWASACICDSTEPRSKTYVVPGIIKQPGRRKAQAVSLFLEAENRQDALWQAHHGVIEMNVSKSFPGAKVTYDLRKLICHSPNTQAQPRGLSEKGQHE